MGFELRVPGPQRCFDFLRLAASLVTSNWFRWSLRPQPVETYEVKLLFAIRFLLPFPTKVSAMQSIRAAYAHAPFRADRKDRGEVASRAC
jgi:hypothetical protein